MEFTSKISVVCRCCVNSRNSYLRHYLFAFVNFSTTTLIRAPKSSGSFWGSPSGWDACGIGCSGAFLLLILLVVDVVECVTREPAVLLTMGLFTLTGGVAVEFGCKLGSMFSLSSESYIGT